MKKILTLLLLIVTIVTFSQAPQGFKYQATVRNNSGNLIVNQNVFFKFNIIQKHIMCLQTIWDRLAYLLVLELQL